MAWLDKSKKERKAKETKEKHAIGWVPERELVPLGR